MEMQLQELIEQIKKNGVEVAETEAAAILEAANAEAQKIISDAKSKAETILREAKEENDRLVSVSEEALRQSARNLLITFRESIAKELSSVIGDKVAEVYSSKDFSDLLVKVVTAWSNNSDVDDIALLLTPDDAAALEKTLMSALKAQLLNGVTLKPNSNFDGGFRISVNGGRAYYDYSTEAVTEMLSAYLTPKLTALLKEADKL